MNYNDRILSIDDDNIRELRARYPRGLHFVVGDTHGAYRTVEALMQKILFDPEKDHVFFVGDYNAGGNPGALLGYLSRYYQANYRIPGFHLIRGNHERELHPQYPLENLPDIIVWSGRNMNYYMVHAGMVQEAFDLINRDIAMTPRWNHHAYRLGNSAAGYRRPFRQIIWSKDGLYSHHSPQHCWPSEHSLKRNRACIIHGHTPYPFLMQDGVFSYGDRNLFWENQRVWFSEDLQSFDIDSNVKGRLDEVDDYRGLACICLEMCDEIAGANDGTLTIEGIRNAPNFMFSVRHIRGHHDAPSGDLSGLLHARPKMKSIYVDKRGIPHIG